VKTPEFQVLSWLDAIHGHTMFWAAAVPAVIVANNAKAIHFRISFMAFSLGEVLAEGSGPVARLIVNASGATHLQQRAEIFNGELRRQGLRSHINAGAD
jgi:hypothetical protein